MLRIPSSEQHKAQIRSSQAVRMDGGHAWRSAGRKLSSLCCCCSDWMLRKTSSVQNNLVSSDWLRTGAEHTTRPFIDTYLLANLLICLFTNLRKIHVVEIARSHYLKQGPAL